MCMWVLELLRCHNRATIFFYHSSALSSHRNLSNNKISVLEPGCFENISSSLLVLKLNRNRLAVLPSKVFKLPQLQFLWVLRPHTGLLNHRQGAEMCWWPVPSVISEKWSVTRSRLWTAWLLKGWSHWSRWRCRGTASPNSWTAPFLGSTASKNCEDTACVHTAWILCCIWLYGCSNLCHERVFLWWRSSFSFLRRSRELEHNNLTEVNKGWLYGLRMLRVLRLNQNTVGIIRPDAWEFCQKLEEL